MQFPKNLFNISFNNYTFIIKSVKKQKVFVHKSVENLYASLYQFIINNPIFNKFSG